MTEGTLAATLISATHLAAQLAFIIRVLLKPYREPASRIAWVVVILVLPLLGIFGYILLGEANIGRRRVARRRKITSQLPEPDSLARQTQRSHLCLLPERFTHLFELGKTINGFLPLGGNHSRLLKDSNDAIDAMVADIDNARETVHVMFYIWLVDTNGKKIAEALRRAAQRGVTCRALADSLGSRGMIESNIWRAMRESGVRLARALPISPPPFGLLQGRIDLRNHRKIVVIDNRVTYCGSQNCADPEFRIKPKFGPWVDLMVRFEGPIAIQNQYLFATDWMNEVDEDLSALLRQSIPAADDGRTTALVIGSGPTIRFSAMPETFESLMYTARQELIVTTPYFVPNESMLAALCACAHRGVETTIVFPARNDSAFVAAASRSYYQYLLDAGVRIYEYTGGLLHTKSLTLDGEIALIGSANMDLRSFELNYENNILLHDSALTAEIRNRQQEYIASANPIFQHEIDGWSWQRRLANNVIALLGPVL